MKKFILICLVFTGFAVFTGCEDVVNVRGIAYTFESYQPVAGAQVYVVEEPSINTLTDAEGRFSLDIPISCEIPEITLCIKTDGLVETQSATFSFEDIEALESKTFLFQVPSLETFYIFTSMLGIVPDPARGHIVSTVSKKSDVDPYPIMNLAMGYEGAVAAIFPDTGYQVFSYFDTDPSVPVPFPNLSLTRTTDDGGIVWANVNTGTYFIYAYKQGVCFEYRKVKVRSGVLTNAAPPYSLMQIY